MIRKLSRKEHPGTRSLYEEAFAEDTKAFTDYYYQYCAAENEIYAAEEQTGQFVSMVHLNPYQIGLGDGGADVNYIVAVATSAQYRRRGLMRKLLTAALREMNTQKQPFTFLMPAREEIYRPFDFRFIYRQKQGTLKAGRTSALPLKLRAAAEQDCAGLAAFAAKVLPRYRTFAVHSETYFRRMIYEQACQNGEIVIIQNKEEICGYFFVAREDKLTVREAVITEQYLSGLFPSIEEYLGNNKNIKIYGYDTADASHDFFITEKEVPLMMARIVCLKSFVSYLSARQKVELLLEIKDPLLEDNQGLFQLIITGQGGRLKRLTPPQCQTIAAGQICSIDIGRFTQLAFGYRTAAEIGAPESFQKDWEQVIGLGPVFLNEIV